MFHNIKRIVFKISFILQGSRIGKNGNSSGGSRAGYMSGPANNSSSDFGGENIVVCNCNHEARQLSVKKEGPNNGNCD